MTELQYGELVSSNEEDQDPSTNVEEDFRGSSQDAMEAVTRKFYTFLISFSMATFFHLVMIKVLSRVGRKVPNALLFPKPQVRKKNFNFIFFQCLFISLYLVASKN